MWSDLPLSHTDKYLLFCLRALHSFIVLGAKISTFLYWNSCLNIHIVSEEPLSISVLLQDLTHWLLLKFMAELRARGDETMRGRAGVMRRHLPLSQRERKAGCRNFFWKTFTSC
uniref:Somatostatin/Cortistatin C-terminal domain-containing protein n=1 Tax=Amphilophus citrinellus TaxID=61819 RepID=A0A3Q0SE16_AMPCI